MSKNPRAHVRFKKKYLKKSVDSRNWEMSRQGNSHIRLTFIPTGESITAAGTPSDRNSLNHVFRDVARIEKNYHAEYVMEAAGIDPSKREELKRNFVGGNPTIKVGDKVYLPAHRPQIMEITHDVTTQEAEPQPDIQPQGEEDMSTASLYNPSNSTPRTRTLIPCENAHKRWTDDEMLWLATHVEQLIDIVTEEQLISWCQYLHRSPGAIQDMVRRMAAQDNLISRKKASFVPIYDFDRQKTIARKAGMIDADTRKYEAPQKPRVYGTPHLAKPRPEFVAPDSPVDDFRTLIKTFNEGLLKLAEGGARIEIEITHTPHTDIPQVKVKRKLEEEY